MKHTSWDRIVTILSDPIEVQSAKATNTVLDGELSFMRTMEGQGQTDNLYRSPRNPKLRPSVGTDTGGPWQGEDHSLIYHIPEQPVGVVESAPAMLPIR